MMSIEMPINDMIKRLESATHQLDDINEIKKNLSITECLRDIIELDRLQKKNIRRK